MICMLLAGMAGTTFAQTQKPQVEKTKITAEQRAERQTERLAKTLSLTEDQKKSMYDVNLAAAKKMESQRDDNKESWKAVKQEKEGQYKSILTAEQYQQYTQHKAEMRKKKHGKQGKHGKPHSKGSQEMQHKADK